MFKQRLDKMIFTNGRTDARVVCELYAKIFACLAENEKLDVNLWGDEHIEELLISLPMS